jgi:hypothetical protein
MGILLKTSGIVFTWRTTGSTGSVSPMISFQVAHGLRIRLQWLMMATGIISPLRSIHSIRNKDVCIWMGVSTTGKAGGLISPKRAALLATLKGYPPLGITLWIIGLLPCREY